MTCPAGMQACCGHLSQSVSVRWLARLLVVLVGVVGAACGSGDASEGEAPSSTEQDRASTAAQRSNEVLACLSGDASDEEVTALFERLSVPHESGVGTGLLDGIAAVSARTRGVAVEFEPSTTSARRAEIVGVLKAPPVVAVRRASEGCP